MPTSKVERARSVFGDIVLDDDNDVETGDASLAYSQASDDRRTEGSTRTRTRSSGARSSSGSAPSGADSLELSADAPSSAAPSSAGRSSAASTVVARSSSGGWSGKENAPRGGPVSAWAAAPPRPGFAWLGRDRVRKTQDAIALAAASVRAANGMAGAGAHSGSVNPALVAARRAKAAEHRAKIRQTRQVRDEWEQDKLDAAAFHQQSEEQRRLFLGLKRTLSTKQSTGKAQREQEERFRHLQAVEEESLFKSAVHRDHRQALREEEERRRRMSMAARARLRENHRRGEAQLKLAQIQEDQVLLEERHEASRANVNAKQEYAESRRKSFAFRNGDARRIRMLYQKMQEEQLERENASIRLKLAAEKDVDAEKQRLEQERRQSLANRNAYARKLREDEQQRQGEAAAVEHEYFETKWAAEKDVEEYQRQLAEERRQSLANRNRYAHSQRQQEAQERSAQMEAEHESYELKWAAEKDVEQYLTQLEQQRRDDFAFSNKEAKRQRDVARELREQALMKESESYELKRAADKDAEAYQRQLEKERRESLVWRNKEAARRAKVMKELQSLALEKERESLVLKWAGEEDAKDYLASLAEERRKSLQARGKENLHHRQVEEEIRQQQLMQQAEDEALASAAHKDVLEYKERCAARDRASLQFRGKQAHLRRIEAKEQQVREQALERQNFELETQARTDVEAYIQECKRRRRMSLAVRAKERRQHFKWRSEKEVEERLAYSREVRARLADQRSAELARREERARLAMDAIKHSGCSFNPFAGLL